MRRLISNEKSSKKIEFNMEIKIKMERIKVKKNSELI
jgi:hypothetical protein